MKVHMHSAVIQDSKTDKDSIVLSYSDANKNIEVRISPYFGSNIYQFTYNGHEIFYCDYDLLKTRDWTGCFILWPLPNRVRDKKFEFEGQIYSLETIQRKGGNYPLIHGLVDDQEWQIGEMKEYEMLVQASTYIDVVPGTQIYEYFPFESRLTLTFTLDQNGLRVDYRVVNRSNKNLPFGFALHPYFPLPLGTDNTKVFLPARSVMESDEELLPTGNLIDVQTVECNLNMPVSISDLSLDHVFTDIDRTKSPYIDYLNQKMRVHFESSEDFTHMVVYTKEKSSICLENQTGSIDMINLHNRAMKEKDDTLLKASHLLILSPQQEHKGFVFYRIEEC